MAAQQPDHQVYSNQKIVGSLGRCMIINAVDDGGMLIEVGGRGPQQCQRGQKLIPGQ